MRTIALFAVGLNLALLGALAGCDMVDETSGKNGKPAATTLPGPKMPPLTAEEERIILKKGTERAFTGKYWNHFKGGAYLCRQCGAMLYGSDSKFRSECGWPSFDDEIDGAVTRLRDADGQRTEIICTACKGHLGHVFLGEGFTKKNTRHCVNSASIAFVSKADLEPQKAIFAGGCFWGVEHHMQKVPGVISAVSGYTGGTTKKPTYEDICTGRTGHAEAVEVVFNPRLVTYEQLAKVFFEIHDPTQVNRQGPDAGTQYRSAVYYTDDSQKAAAEKLIAKLKTNGYDVATKLERAVKFWPAEDYHQDFTVKHPDRYICHTPVSRFAEKKTPTKPKR